MCDFLLTYLHTDVVGVTCLEAPGEKGVLLQVLNSSKYQKRMHWELFSDHSIIDS